MFSWVILLFSQVRNCKYPAGSKQSMSSFIIVPRRKRKCHLSGSTPVIKVILTAELILDCPAWGGLWIQGLKMQAIHLKDFFSLFSLTISFLRYLQFKSPFIPLPFLEQVIVFSFYEDNNFWIYVFLNARSPVSGWHLALWPGMDRLIFAAAKIFWWLRSKLGAAIQWKLKTRTHCSCKPTVNARERECQPASVNDCQEADANAGYHIVCCYTWQLSKQYQGPRDYSSTWCNAPCWPHGQEQARQSVMFTRTGANPSLNKRLRAIVNK